MFQKITFYRSLLVIIISILLVVLIVYAFSEPNQPPPGGNVPAPLNVGPSGQSKAGGLILNTGGAATGLIVDKGNVGIGTTAPGGKLGILSGWGNWIRFYDSIAGNQYMFHNPSDGSRFEVGVYDAGAATTRWGVLTIRPSGNVGIGTTNPQVRLDVQGGWVRIGDPASNAIQFETQSGFHRVAFKDLRFWDWDTGGDMVTFNNGNVGIGTTAPTQKLDVAGFVKGRSGLCIGDDCRTSWPAGGSGSWGSCTWRTVPWHAHTWTCANGEYVAGIGYESDEWQNKWDHHAYPEVNRLYCCKL